MSDNTEVYRIIDANLNRLREGLRAVEEQARFLWDDLGLTSRTKGIRHSVKVLEEQYIPQDMLLLNRDSAEDVGQNIDPESETARGDMGDILVSNLKRAQEAARVLEEYSKLVNSELSVGFKNVRFDLYNLEQEYFKARSLDFSLYLLASGPEGLAEALENGVDLVQYRDKDSPDSVRLSNIKEIQAITKEAGVPLIINDRPDLCVLTNSAGVHLGQDDMPVEAARKIVGPGRIVGFSTHSLTQARKADEAGADYIAIGPVFATESKGIPIEPIGLEVLKQVLDVVQSPVVAIGGINADNIDQVLETGVRRMAVIGGILGGGDPGENARILMDKMLQFRKKGTDGSKGGT
jgi:thiamine-phosphate pyrophosphorylase